MSNNVKIYFSLTVIVVFLIMALASEKQSGSSVHDVEKCDAIPTVVFDGTISVIVINKTNSIPLYGAKVEIVKEEEFGERQIISSELQCEQRKKDRQRFEGSTDLDGKFTINTGEVRFTTVVDNVEYRVEFTLPGFESRSTFYVRDHRRNDPIDVTIELLPKDLL